MIERHTGRLGNRGFILRLGQPGPTTSMPEGGKRYWEIEYDGRLFPWRPVHAEDESDVPSLIRGAMTYLRGEVQRQG